MKRKHHEEKLKENILNFYKTEKKGHNNDKKFVRKVIKSFNKKYGMYMIYHSIFELTSEKKIVLSRKILNKIKNKIDF